MIDKTVTAPPLPLPLQKMWGEPQNDITIIFKRKWWQIWKKETVIRIPKEQAQEIYNKNLSNLLEQIKCQTNQ